MKSIRTKLFATYAALLILTIVVLGAGFTWFIRGFYIDTLRERLAEEARVTGELLRPYVTTAPTKDQIARIDGFISALGENINARITLVATDGVVLGDSAENAALMDNHLTRPEIRAAVGDAAGSAIRYSRTVNENMLYVAVSLTENGQNTGYLRLALPLARLNSALRRVQLGLMAGLFLVLLLVLAISLKLSGGLTRPLEQMAEVAERIAAGELKSRIYLRNRDETGTLATAINRMAESLEEQVRHITESRDQLESVLSTMVEGVLVFDADGRAVMANPAAEQMLGLQKTNWQGRRVLEIVRNTELHEKILMTGRDRVFLEHEIITGFPDKKVLMVTLVPVSPAVSEVRGVLAVFHDVTRLRTLEAMRADFAANVSHELRTPLTAIQGFAETLLDGAYKEEESARRFAEIIHREAKRLNSLIEDVLKLSQIESGKTTINLQPVEVEMLVADVMERIGDRTKGHKVKIKTAQMLPPVLGDRGLLGQALYNLVENAAKYTHQGGTITVLADNSDGYIRLSVSDNGIGIPDEAKERIFERFYRVERARSRRLGGTGLGLAIVKHIVEAHRGKLELESEEGKGTRVSMYLPIADL
ncbi:MAG: ATP-binding protein [Bacillota bacterium]|nr:ATP-binding protein [Bacillota bacterium]MDW7683915.1 ATP-binding protein [Bacillota bacterium]